LGEAVEILTFHGLAYRLLCAFGRYVGMDGTPTLLGEARTKLALTAASGTRVTYDQLLPRALQFMETQGPLSDLLASRWRLVICDEFQDTDDVEWRLLQFLGQNARLLLLADPNQMIYGFKAGVSEARLHAARARPDITERTLPPARIETLRKSYPMRLERSGGGASMAHP
jgi:DNA helicase-2/ATP-dependent DNA helicase PcrA